MNLMNSEQSHRKYRKNTTDRPMNYNLEIFKNSASHIVRGNDQNGQFFERLEDWQIDQKKRNYNQTDNDRIDNGNELNRKW